MKCVCQGYSMAVNENIKFGAFTPPALTDCAAKSCQHHLCQEPDVCIFPLWRKDGQMVI